MYTYHPKGTCSTAMEIEIQDGIITHCRIINGCRGNTQGLSAMVIGRNAEEVAAKLEGIQCRGGTSCPDQLSKAIRACQAERSAS